jgi:hypothetical protein
VDRMWAQSPEQNPVVQPGPARSQNFIHPIVPTVGYINLFQLRINFLKQWISLEFCKNP